MKKTLNVGAGELTYKFYPTDKFLCTNFDSRDLKNINEVGDVRDLSRFNDEEFDYILASDIIEHFPIKNTAIIIKEWSRVLKPNGVIEFRLPNLAVICNQYNTAKDARNVSWLLYGGQDYSGNFHYVCFDRKLFMEEYSKAGLKEISYKEIGFNMVVKVRKGEK